MIDLPRWFTLNRREFERQFALPSVELKEIVALDALELLPEQSSIKVISHDPYGPLPQITLQIDPTDRLGAFDRLGREAVRLCIISHLRREVGGGVFRSVLPASYENRRQVRGGASMARQDGAGRGRGLRAGLPQAVAEDGQEVSVTGSPVVRENSK